MLFWIISFIIGAVFGSFLNVCIYRLPRKLSIITPRSHCPECQHLIPWYDNIPILSYILLRGRCRFCDARIAPTYLIVEVITAVVFLTIFMKFGFSVKLPIYLVFFCLLIIITFIDLERQLIPDVIAIPGIIVGIATSFFTVSLRSSLLGAATGALVIVALAVIGKAILKKEAMGGGDIRLLAMIGSFLGWVDVLSVLFIGSFIGLIFGLSMRQRELPFGPYLAAAAFIVIMMGSPTRFLGY